MNAAVPRACALLALCVPAVASAQLGVDDNRRIPYTGRLERNSGAAEGAHRFRFALFTSAAADASCLANGVTSCGAWAEEHVNVAVAAGAFSVVLGSVTPLADAVLANNSLHLAIAVRGPADPAFTVLPQKQQVLTTPVAARAVAATDYKVTGLLDARGNTRLINASNAGVRIGTGPSVGGARNNEAGDVGIYLGTGGELEVDRDGTQALTIGDAITHRLNTSVAGTLSVTGATTLAGLQVNGDTASTGSITLDGQLRMQCPAAMTRIGTWCIDDARSTPNTWGAASSACHSAGKGLCSVDALLLCDTLNLPAPTSQCKADTDNSSVVLWTSGTAYDTFGAGSAFNELAAYNGDNSVDRFPDGAALGYYCCVPGYWR